MAPFLVVLPSFDICRSSRRATPHSQRRVTSDTAVIHHLGTSDVSAVIADVLRGSAVSKRVSLLLANGSTIEFETGTHI